MDAITMLKNDHRAVEKLFKQFEEAGDRAFVTKRDLVDEMIEELSKHAAIEEQLFYPVTRETVPETEDEVLESLEEHHIVKWLLSELEDMDPHHERFDAKVTVLIENVRHHVEEEEGDYFHKVRDELGRKALGELGDAMEKVKAVAPTHPHPRTPDDPSANFVLGTASGVVDRVGDTVSGLAQGGMSAVADVVDRARGKTPRRASPKGTSTARTTADAVRSGTNDALDRVIDAVRDARDTGRTVAERAQSEAAATLDQAESTAKRTVGTAKRGAADTAATAKTAAKRTTGSAKQAVGSTATTAKRGARKTGSTAKRSVAAKQR